MNLLLFHFIWDVKIFLNKLVLNYWLITNFPLINVNDRDAQGHARNQVLDATETDQDAYVEKLAQK